ncbi:Glucose-6-phosphate isomerase [Fructilactobacillus florum 8D]|uniref:Glucose-6-phosphate isomerase n=2 Tax=Fructilactobacillus florum TaxID=640331 RepID=W9EGS8_9LACO|nr:glucose-6-phosphate isomerase [Fructilactobacillus florum]ETO40220.1 Glucose-6-phosphate isomerase [Fructilactobacillus florum 8D]KRM92484.1 glucose-6-phosphate isomerase [Fructilactobacillus florum DSM 22689 = JCM 16035]
MSYIKFDDSKVKKFVHENELPEMQALVTAADQELRQGTGAGSDFRDWLDLPSTYDQDEFSRIQRAAEKIRKDSEVLVVIGIGGSYLGAKMAVDFLNGTFYNTQPSSKRRGVQVVFAGNSLSASYLQELTDFIGDRDFSINIISKSGTTTEPSIAFRLLKAKLIKKYGENEANQRIYATTDAKHGALRQEATASQYETFVIPDGVGGRYSVLTPVGLLPIAATGADLNQLMKGASDAAKAYAVTDLKENPAYRYAALRNILYRKGYSTELVENYEPNLRMFAEWWKQLMGESEGKDQKGIYPSSANFTTDLHSLGQYIQEGLRDLFETVIKVKEPPYNLDVPMDEKNLDGLNYLQGMSLNEVNERAYEGVVLAHNDGGVPVLTVEIPDESEYSLGYLIYFFEVAVAISGYLNGINPFNQPGVEAYKKNMFALLGKPGYEELGQRLNRELNQ